MITVITARVEAPAVARFKKKAAQNRTIAPEWWFVQGKSPSLSCLPFPGLPLNQELPGEFTTFDFLEGIPAPFNFGLSILLNQTLAAHYLRRVL